MLILRTGLLVPARNVEVLPRYGGRSGPGAYKSRGGRDVELGLSAKSLWFIEPWQRAAASD